MFNSVNVVRQLVLALSTLVLMACSGGSGGNTAVVSSVYDVSVTVTGLTGTLTLANGTDTLSLAAGDNGTRQSITSGLDDGTAFDVILTSQPIKQLCQFESAASATGTIAAASTNIIINCEDTFDVNVTVLGLNPNSFLTVLNGNDSVTFDSNINNTPIVTTLMLTTGLVNNDSYSVSIGSNPIKQLCTVDPTAGSANIAGSDANVTISCVDTYDVNVTVTGLTAGTFLTLVNGSDSVTFDTDATLTLTSGLLDAAAYTVTVGSQPVGQLCRILPVAAGSSNIAANDADIAVSCGTMYALGVSVQGLNGSVTVVNGNDSVTLNTDGSALLSTLLSGTGYTVSVATQPIGQECKVVPIASATGTITNAAVNVGLTCTNLPYFISVDVKGVTGTGAPGLSLQNKTDTLSALTVDGIYKFAAPLVKDEIYAVSVTGTPGGLTCSVTSGFGTIVASDVIVSISCSTITYTVSATVTGLTGTLVLENNNNALDPLSFTADSTKIFNTQLVDGSGYDVTIATQPASQFCTVNAAKGTVPTANVAVTVSCAPAYTVSANVSNFSGTLTLQNNAGDPLVVTANGVATFSRPLLDGQPYVVSVLKQTGQECTVDATTAAGNIAAASVSINVVCITERTVSANVTNFNGSLVLQNNATDSLTINATGKFDFAIPVLDGNPYAITVLNQTGQECTVNVLTATGSVTGNTTVDVVCVTERSVSVDVINFNGSLTVQNNLADDLIVPATGLTKFKLPVLEGSPYSVTVLSNVGQVCSLVDAASASGTVAKVDISVAIACVTERVISVSVTGFGGSLTVINNKIDSLDIFQDGTFRFSNPILDGNLYAVSIGALSGQKCLLAANAAGTINGADINVNILCAADADNDGYFDINDFYPNNPNLYAKEQFDLSALNGANGFVIKGIDNLDSSGISVSSIADINGDGINEIMIGATGAQGTGRINNVPEQVNNVGETYIIFGSNVPGYWNATFDLASLDGNTGFKLLGADELDNSGFSVSGLGDINGDSIPDFIIGAPKANIDSNAVGTGPNDIDNIGESYVMFGKADWSLTPALDLKNLTIQDGFTITGIAEIDLSGYSVSNAGDVNGDGIDDIIIGAQGANAGVKISAGQTYVLFGRDAVNTWPLNFDLGSLLTGGGVAGFVINGAVDNDFSGWSVSGAGDVNGDLIDDILVGAQGASPNGLSLAGATYVIYGRKANGTVIAPLWPQVFDLATMTVSDGFIIGGAAAGDGSGISVSGAGDINKDGLNDIIIGASKADDLIAPGNLKSDVGGSYIIFGSAAARNLAFSLSGLNGTNGFSIKGINISDQSGIAVSNAGDVNGDGIDDILIGATLADPNGIGLAGESYVIFGHTGSWLSNFDLTTMSGLEGFTLNGIAEGDNTGVAVSSAGDINGDGISDVIIGANLADTSTTIVDSGKTFVIFGCNYTSTDPALLCKK